MQRQVKALDFIKATQVAVDKSIKYVNTMMDNRLGTPVIPEGFIKADIAVSFGSMGTAAASYSWREASVATPQGKRNARIVKGAIVMPGLPLSARLSRYEADLWTGYWIHEVGHVLFSDIEAVVAAYERGGKPYQHLLNALEDARMEHRLHTTAAVPNAERTTSLLHNHLTEKAIQGAIESKADINSPEYFPMMLHKVLSIEWQKRSLFSKHYIYKHLKPAVLKTCQDIAAEMPNCKDIWDCLKLVEKYFPPNPPQKQPQPQPQPQQGQGTGQGQGSKGKKGKGQGQGAGGAGQQGEQPEDAAEPGEAAGGNGAGDGDEAEGSTERDRSVAPPGAGGGAQPSSGNGSSSSTATTGGEYDAMGELEMDRIRQAMGDATTETISPEPDITDLAKEITERAWNDRESNFDMSTVVMQGYHVENYSMPAKEAKNYEGAIAAINQLCASSGGKMRRNIRELLMSTDRGGREHHQVRGRLSSAHIATAAAGNNRVFNRRWEEPGFNTAVSVLVDLSSSMSGPSADMASNLCLILSDCLNKAGVPYEVTGFTDASCSLNTYYSSTGLVHESHSTVGMPDRVRGMMAGTPSFVERKEDDDADRTQVDGSCKLHVFKRYDQRNSMTKYMLAAMRNAPVGGTPDLFGILAAGDRLKQVKAKRKVLFVIVDGGGHAEYIPAAVRELNKDGIDVIGLGIGFKVSEQYNIGVTVTATDQLLKAGLGLVLKQLKRNSVHAKPV